MIEAGLGRPLRRHQRDPLEGSGPDHRRSGAHALARADADGHRRGEARRGARPGARWWSASSSPTCSPSRAGAPQRITKAGSPAPPRISACRCAPPAASSAAISRSPRPRPRPSSGAARPCRRRAGRAETRIPGRLDVVARAAAHRLRRRAQSGGRTGARGLARRRARRAPPPGGGDRRARGQGRRRHAQSAAAAPRPRDLHTVAQPALAPAGHARHARGEDRRAGGPARPRTPLSLAPTWCPTPVPRLSGRACWPARRRGARHGLDLPGRRPGARAAQRARFDPLISRSTCRSEATRPSSAAGAGQALRIRKCRETQFLAICGNLLRVPDVVAGFEHSLGGTRRQFKRTLDWCGEQV